MAFDPTKAAGMGTDTIDDSVMGMPFINIIQKGSAEFDETSKDYAKKGIAGCKPGDIYFAPTRTVLKRPLPIIPLAQTMLYTEWKPRGQGGGFLGHRDMSIVADPNYRKGDQANKKDKYKEYLGTSELVYTIYVAVLFQDGEKWKRGIINFTSTQLKHARLWMKDIKNVKYTDLPNVVPPIFAAQWLLSTLGDNNVEGSWYAWQIKKDRVLDFTKDEQLLETAMVAAKQATAELPAAAAEEPKALPPGGSQNNAAAAYKGPKHVEKVDEEVPF